jgi:DNA-binding transcriptional regulator YbjK
MSARPVAPASRRGAGRRRHEPDRRQRILEVTLDVIAAHGVAGTTHRKVAAAADVPLGAMTYYFRGLADLLSSAFTVLAQRWGDAFESAMAAVPQGADPREAVADAVLAGLADDADTDPVTGSRRQAVLAYELYALAARDPAVREVTQAWMERTRAALRRHFAPEDARVLDALVEGLTQHAVLSTEPLDPVRFRADVARLAPPPLARPVAP